MSVSIFKRDQLNEMIDELNKNFRSDRGVVLLLDQPLSPKQAQLLSTLQSVVCFAVTDAQSFGGSFPHYIHGQIENPDDQFQMLRALESAQRILDLQHENQILRLQMQSQTDRLEMVLQAALEISEEKEPDRLYSKILNTMRRLAHCEGASLYLMDSNEKDKLRFKYVQNEKMEFEFEEFLLPIDEKSMAGASAFRREVVLVPDVSAIPSDSPFHFNRSFDKKTGYVTKSALCIPLAKSKGELVGLIQLINSKKKIGFSHEDIEIAKGISCHIAAALEAVILYQDIENLFEGIIKASVKAIESRDPNTSGHSERVGRMAVALARAAHESSEGVFQDVCYTEDQLKEIRYAATLHDFGKIGVPEEVLLKAKKLFPHQYEILQMRIEMLGLAYPERRDEFTKLWSKIEKLNEPTINIEELGEDLSSYVNECLDVHGKKVPIITESEWTSLSVKKGTLTSADRAAVESHVLHSVNFLEQIPWTGELSNIPEIVLRHHETLDGTGYPHQVPAEQIPFETQVISIVDIFDALTAQDRSYKKAVPIDRTIMILEDMAQKRKLNMDLVALFKEHEIYKAREE